MNEVSTLGEKQGSDFSDIVGLWPPSGSRRAREAIAEMHGVSAECVQVVTGASEALVVLMWLAAEPGANVILPQPGYEPFSALPESLGLETRFYDCARRITFASH